MSQGSDNVTYRRELLKVRMDEGQCGYCRPNRGENSRFKSRSRKPRNTK